MRHLMYNAFAGVTENAHVFKEPDQRGRAEPWGRLRPGQAGRLRLPIASAVNEYERHAKEYDLREIAAKRAARRSLPQCGPQVFAVNLAFPIPERRQAAFRFDHDQTNAAEDQSRRLGEDGGGKP